AVTPRQSTLARQRREARFIEQHPTGEDVGLDEVGAARIAVEQAVLEGDELQRRTTARLQIARDAIEISAPPRFADRLDHLDRGDRIELLRRRAIILQEIGRA